MPLSEFLKSVLVCPLSHAPLVEDGNQLVSTDPKTRRAYLVEDDIPRMLIDESRELPEGEWKELMKKHGYDEKGQKAGA